MYTIPNLDTLKRDSVKENSLNLVKLSCSKAQINFETPRLYTNNLQSIEMQVNKIVS